MSSDHPGPPSALTLPSGSSAEVDATVCGVCPHDLSRHDTISLRFCRATQDQVLTRGCACPASAR